MAFFKSVDAHIDAAGLEDNACKSAAIPLERFNNSPTTVSEKNARDLP